MDSPKDFTYNSVVNKPSSGPGLLSGGHFLTYSFYVKNIQDFSVPVIIQDATEVDYLETVENHWQTDWTTGFIQQEKYHKVAMYVKETHELIGLCAYYPLPTSNCLRLVYMECAPSSNPTLVKRKQRKYYGIGKCFIAFHVLTCLQEQFDGTLVFKAKTTELFWHYIKDFGAIPLRRANYELILFPENGIPLLESFQDKEART